MTDQLGTLLRRLRNQAGLTQQELAERSGVSIRTISRLETGKATDHRLGTVNLLADALEPTPEDRRRLAAMLAKDHASTAPEQPETVAGPAEADSAPSAPLPGPPSLSPSAPPPGPPSVPLPGPASLSSSAGDALVGVAAELAREVGRRWRREEEQHRVHDPFPLPVRWQPAPADLTDHAENIERLPPGATSPRMELSGDLRSVADVYRKIPSGRLVVLGRAGSGKSILTIRLILNFLESPAVSGRVPVIFSIGDWDATAITLRDWLIGRLLRDYQHLARRTPGGMTLAAALVDADLVLPVLDGFDEIAESLRCETLEALNATSLPLVLTSRRDEYAEAVRAARAPLVWAAGIELTDLTPDDLTAYLPRTARLAAHSPGPDRRAGAWDTVLEELRSPKAESGVHLARVLSTPLMVVLARTMYSEAPDRDSAELLNTERFPTEHALEEHLLAGFVPAVYRPRVPERGIGGSRRPPRNWDPERARRWLGYLAHHMVRLDRDRQDLAWWQIGDSLRRSTRTTAVVLASALCITVSTWLVGLLAGVITPGEILAQGAMMGPAGGLAFGSVYAVLAALDGGVFAPSQVRLRLHTRSNGIGRRPLRTFAARFGAVLLGGFVMGTGCACAFALERALYYGHPLALPDVFESALIDMLIFGLIFGSAAGLVFGVIAALEAPLDVSSAATPISLLSANRATVGRQILVIVPVLSVAIALGGFLIVDVFRGVFGPLGWSLPNGILIGTVGGLGGAFSYALCFTAWGQWLTLVRVWLPLTGKLPWNTGAFLDDAYRRGVLRRTGAVYQFRHARLQHHLGHVYRLRQPNYAPARFPASRTPPTAVVKEPDVSR